MDISTIKPLDKVITQLRKLHLFNICSKEKIYPQTYAKGVIVIDANGEEKDLQSYLESLNVKIENNTTINNENDMQELKNEINELKAKMNKILAVLKDVMEADDSGQVVITDFDADNMTMKLTTDEKLKYEKANNIGTLKADAIDVETAYSDVFYEN